MDDEVKALCDRLDVSDVITRYAFAVDQHDWTGLTSIFADTVHLEVPHVDSPESPLISRENLVQMIHDTVSGFEATHHLIPNRLVTISGDRASCKAYANAWHTIPTERGVADYCLVRGYYDWGLIRTPDGWRIDRLVITIAGPADGYMGLYQIARERVSAP
jgi:hypothetical protein